MSLTVIQSIDPGSPAERAGVRVGETLTHVGAHPIVDVLDYKYYTYDAHLELALKTLDGSARTLRVKKRDGEDLGLNFETYLMDRARCCANNCIFCFVDQLPQGMRDSLYFKDDDARLSFLTGNYITLTNLSERELQRIVDLRISPLNISVHATNPELRAQMLGHRNGGAGMELLRRFAAAGITMNCQIVSCPGINDGPELQRSMEDLASLYPGVNSVSIVPVGLTKHRQGLSNLRPYEKIEAAAVVDMVEEYGRACREKHGTTLFWCSDEFYLKAGRALPENKYYEEYTQLENGVGMLRLLMTEFRSALSLADEVESITPFSAATGLAAAPFISALIDMAAVKCHTRKGQVFPLVNNFFGETIDVAGLITGKDLITQLRGKELGERLLIPVNMLRHGEDVFLDDVTIADVERELKVRVRPVNQDGFDLCDAIFET
ncbi:putative FeS-containing Cyanobacterial-specific oxidoreductase [uncultured Eubacteriales bacterium]|uniref:Putative FeS-containing Cyanobacterial-specific oxidoreductase n=1 Tax=uncultured Eubacteriales bacterium TaxID=172733 RepID=A0A212K140_9FIRM|nr:putative FeS-containing Cyanobacterial-specific oxidoreductase [uncultured Eubacteriales bacterium]